MDPVARRVLGRLHEERLRVRAQQRGQPRVRHQDLLERCAGIRIDWPLSCAIRWNGELPAPRKIGRPIIPSLPTVATSAPKPLRHQRHDETIPLVGKYAYSIGSPGRARTSPRGRLISSSHGSRGASSSSERAARRWFCSRGLVGHVPIPRRVLVPMPDYWQTGLRAKSRMSSERIDASLGGWRATREPGIPALLLRVWGCCTSGLAFRRSLEGAFGPVRRYGLRPFPPGWNLLVRPGPKVICVPASGSGSRAVGQHRAEELLQARRSRSGGVPGSRSCRGAGRSRRRTSAASSADGPRGAAIPRRACAHRQPLSSGMVLIGVDTAWQDIVIGLVLVAAVGVDTVLRRQRT